MAWVDRAGLGAFLVEKSPQPKPSHSPSLALWPRLTLGLSPSAALVLAAECAVFLGALAVGRNVGIAAPLLVALALVRCRYEAMEAPSVRLLQLVGLVSAGYALFHYPFLPIAEEIPYAPSAFAGFMLLWAMAVFSGALCLRWPSLALIAAAFPLWSKYAVERFTGLPHQQALDVVPLAAVGFCLALGLLVAQIFGRLSSGTLAKAQAAAAPVFAQIVFIAAVSIHLANYFSSFRAKIGLDGDETAWLMKNDPSNIFLVALDNNHVFFSGWSSAIEYLRLFLNHWHLVTNALILIAQGAAILGFLMPRSLLLILLLGFDGMHLAILLAQGANFWPWILLNVVIGTVIFAPEYRKPPVILGLFSVLFILLGDRITHQAWLGWFDTKANNKIYFEAVEENGRRTYVPTNFFTFYSYPFSHMDYGSPQPETAFEIGNPNGGTHTYRKVAAAETCNVAELTRPDPPDFHVRSREPIDYPRFDTFVRNYHALAEDFTDRLGVFPYWLYPHHFYEPAGTEAHFAGLDLHSVVAYIYRRESVCLSIENGSPVRRVISTAEHRIDLPR